MRVDGWPIAHHVFRGNLRDAQTIEPVLDDLRQRFGLRRVVSVGDRGMMTCENLDRIRSRGQGYLLGLKRRRNEQVRRYIEQAQGPWQDCPAGIRAREKSVPPRTRVREVGGDEACVRVFVVDSEQRREYEQAQREKAMEALPEELEALQQRVAAGKLKAPEKVGAVAARILDRRHGSRYFGWEYKAGQFRYYEHPVHFEREEALGALATVRLLDLELPQGESNRLVTRASRRAQRVLKALGISDRRPPGGPDQKPRM